MGVLLLVGPLFTLIGFGVLIGGVVTAVKQSRQSAGRVPATGRVVGLVKRVFTAGSAGVYCPVVEFTAASGESIRFESDFGTMPASHSVGQSIAVRYDSVDPQKAEVDSTTSRWLVPGCMVVMGIAFLCMGVLFTVMGALALVG